jgi:hypothetical protein
MKDERRNESRQESPDDSHRWQARAECVPRALGPRELRAVTANTLVERSVEALIGLVLIVSAFSHTAHGEEETKNDLNGRLAKPKAAS